MHQSELTLTPLPTDTITTNNNNNHSSCCHWGLVHSPSPLPSPALSPLLSLSTHSPSPSLSPLCRFRYCHHICKPWLLQSPPPYFAVAVVVAVTPPPQLLQHIQPMYEIMHSSTVDDGGGPCCRRLPLPFSTSSLIAVAIVTVAVAAVKACTQHPLQILAYFAPIADQKGQFSSCVAWPTHFKSTPLCCPVDCRH